MGRSELRAGESKEAEGATAGYAAVRYEALDGVDDTAGRQEVEGERLRSEMWRSSTSEVSEAERVYDCTWGRYKSATGSCGSTECS